MKIGIFGGSFNPPHNGHFNSMLTVAKKLGLQKVIVVPTNQNPLKIPIEGPTPNQRFEMTKLAVESWGGVLEVSDIEIRRGGKSYTIDTIKELRKNYSADELFLIIGLDQFQELESWRKPEEILTESNLVVTSRPGFDLPTAKEELPKFVQDLVADYDFNFVELKSGRSIQFISLEDVLVSGTQLRKWIRIGKNVQKYLPLAVENYIKENGIYKGLASRIGDYEKFAHFCGRVLLDKKAINVKAFDLRKMSAPSEFTLVASGTSTRHAASLGENLMAAVKEEFNVFPQAVEGLDEGRWVVVDYGQLMIHVFYDFVRTEYSIESLWKDAKSMHFE